MYFYKYIYKIIGFACVAVLSAVIAACGNEEIEAPVVRDPATTFRLTLTVISNTASETRGDRDDDFEEIGSDAENYLNFTDGDFRIILFDKEGEYLMEFGPDDDWTLEPGPLYGYNYQKYLMEIEYNFPDSFDYDRLEEFRNEGIQIMVIANCKSLESNFDYSGKFGVNGSSNLSEIWRNNTTLNYQYALGANLSTWLPEFSDTRKRLIPMFGFTTISKFQPKYTNGPYSASVVVPMQRAMAKIEVVDNLERVNLSLQNVTMTDYNQTGRVIPNIAANPDWDQIGKQVTSSSLPANPNNYKPNGGVRFWNDAPNKTWIAYVPEMALGTPVFERNTNIFNPDRNSNRTHINIDVDFGDGKSEIFPLHFAQYTPETFQPSIPDQSWNHVLRNHIYRFYINNVGVSTEIELHVVPWNLDDDEVWDYTDHVTIGEMLQWKTGSYESLDEETGRLLLWIDPKEPFLEGWFRIKTPLNGRWYARLTPLDDARPNAITFVDEYGEPLEPSHGVPPVCLEASGIIEEESPAWIRIKPTNWGNEEMSAFKLEFFVENLNVWIRVPMVDGDGKEYQEYTIVRKANRQY